MNIEEKLKIVTGLLEDKKGLDIISIDVRKITTLTDYFVVCSGSSNRHRKSLADDVVKKSRELGFEVMSKEGMSSADWILIDLNDIVVNIFSSESRKRYNLERLWSEGVLKEIRGEKE